MKKFLKYSGICALLLALVAFILMMATPAIVGTNSDFAVKGTIAVFGGSEKIFGALAVTYSPSALALIGNTAAATSPMARSTASIPVSFLPLLPSFLCITIPPSKMSFSIYLQHYRSSGFSILHSLTNKASQFSNFSGKCGIFTDFSPPDPLSKGRNNSRIQYILMIA